MQNRIVLVSNNQELCVACVSGRFVDGSSLDVLIEVRNAVHKGARLLTHPLCGNLRPYQQPFRSILVQEALPASREDTPYSVDFESLSLIENAVSVYESCKGRLLLPSALTLLRRRDYAFIDAELMRESLEQYGLGCAVAALQPAPLCSVTSN